MSLNKGPIGTPETRKMLILGRVLSILRDAINFNFTSNEFEQLLEQAQRDKSLRRFSMEYLKDQIDLDRIWEFKSDILARFFPKKFLKISRHREKVKELLSLFEAQDSLEDKAPESEPDAIQIQLNLLLARIKAIVMHFRGPL